MRKATIKRLAAYMLTISMIFGESGVAAAAETVPAHEDSVLCAEAVLEEGDFGEETSEAETSEAEASAESGEDAAGAELSSTESGESTEAGEASEESMEPSAEEPSESTEPSTDEAFAESGEAPGETDVFGESAEISGTEAVVPAKFAAEGDKSLKACGSDGILYSGVTYLSASTVLGFDADTREAYLELCDEIALWKQNGDAVSDIVLFTDTNGDLGFSYFVTNEYFSVEEARKEQEENVSGNETDMGVTILGTTDAEDVPGDTDGGTAAGENLSLADSVTLEEETFELDEGAKTFDTAWFDENLFKNQLTSVEKTIYNAAKSKMVKGNSNSCSFTTSVKPTSANICNALSAIQDTYPSSFEWAERGNGGASTKGYLRGGTWELQTTIKKSKHYSSSLLSSAKKQTKKLVEEAYAYAEKNYANAPTYGMIKYFDDWICSNNYYNNIGLGNTANDLKSKEFYYCHSSIGILLKGYGVCESYALAMNRLLDEAGIPSMVVYGTGNGGGHAWNYVLMPNGYWYLLDSTWNDAGASSNAAYLLSAADSSHVALGARFNAGKNFTYPKLATSRYSHTASSEPIFLNKTELVLTKGKKAKLSSTGSYWDRFKYKWESSNPKIAKVDAKGNVTAAAPGKATISYKIAGKRASCTVYVYQWSGLQFINNHKASYTYNYGNADTVFNEEDQLTFYIDVKQKNASLSAAEIQGKTGLAAPKATTNNTKVATVSSCTLSSTVDRIVIRVRPLKTGTAKINVSFGGKKATLTLKVKQNLQNGWFNNLPISSAEYTGKAITPRVTASASMPRGVKYKVTYKNNKNAGIATVVITGTGSYSGTIQESFRINPRDFSKAVFVSCSSSKVFNGKANPAATVVKWKGRKLKAGVDYDVYYNNSNSAPINAGTYTVKVTGKGNYSGALEKTFTYTIQKAPITKLKVSCPSTVKYKGGNYVTPVVTVKIGSTVIDLNNYTLKWKDASGADVVGLKEKGKYTLIISPKAGGNLTATKTKTEIKKTVRVR